MYHLMCVLAQLDGWALIAEFLFASKGTMNQILGPLLKESSQTRTL